MMWLHSVKYGNVCMFVCKLQGWRAKQGAGRVCSVSSASDKVVGLEGKKKKGKKTASPYSIELQLKKSAGTGDEEGMHNVVVILHNQHAWNDVSIGVEVAVVVLINARGIVLLPHGVKALILQQHAGALHFPASATAGTCILYACVCACVRMDNTSR